MNLYQIPWVAQESCCSVEFIRETPFPMHRLRGSVATEDSKSQVCRYIFRSRGVTFTRGVIQGYY